MRRFGRIIFWSLCGVIAIIVAVLNPAVMLLVMISIASLMMVLRQLNTFRIALHIKRFIQTASKLRSKLRASLRIGFHDYSDLTVEHEDKNLRNGHCGYVR
ncbi:MAG: hypothetical protein ACFCUE_02145 [Candidatus Bathyarchaeia archaeon]|jgi:hypothetical protein